MFLTDLNQDDLESIANHSFSSEDGDEDVIQNIFFNFRVKLLCMGLPFNNDSNEMNCTSITTSFIKSTLCQFNHFYQNSTDNGFVSHKEFYQRMEADDFDAAPCTGHIGHFIEKITCHNERALMLYAFGLVITWDQKNTWSFFAESEAKKQQEWFANFYSLSNSYFLLWEPLVTNIAVSSTISEQNSKAAKAKHKNSELTKLYAIKCYTDSSYKSVKQAALNISPNVIEYGKKVGFVFSSDYQAIDTIYKWFLNHNKKDK